MEHADHCGVAMGLSPMRNMHSRVSPGITRRLSHKADDTIFGGMKGIVACLNARRAVWDVFDG